VVRISGSERLMQEAPSTDKQFVVYEGAYHEFFVDEKVCERAFADVFQFVDDRLSNTTNLVW
jgi:alpha-beta hydrolase superfamily lysophospholipase